MDDLFKDGSNLTYDRLDVAKSVLVELRGKHEVATARARKRPPPPPPPPTLPQHAGVRLAEVFYNVKNGSSFITSKSWSKNLSNENKH